jgi:hypothetical protein
VFDAEPLRVTVATVLDTALTFFVSHNYTPYGYLGIDVIRSSVNC